MNCNIWSDFYPYLSVLPVLIKKSKPLKGAKRLNSQHTFLTKQPTQTEQTTAIATATASGCAPITSTVVAAVMVVAPAAQLLAIPHTHRHIQVQHAALSGAVRRLSAPPLVRHRLAPSYLPNWAGTTQVNPGPTGAVGPGPAGLGLAGGVAPRTGRAAYLPVRRSHRRSGPARVVSGRSAP